MHSQTPKEAQTLVKPIEEDPETKKKNLEETLAQPVCHSDIVNQIHVLLEYLSNYNYEQRVVYQTDI